MIDFIGCGVTSSAYRTDTNLVVKVADREEFYPLLTHESEILHVLQIETLPKIIAIDTGKLLMSPLGGHFGTKV